MAATVTATHSLLHSIQETYPATDTIALGEQILNYAQFNKVIGPLTASTAPPATMIYAEKITGTTTLDFTALARTLGDDLDTTGLKLQSIAVENLSTTNIIDVEDGAANAYTINDNDDIQVPIGGTLFMHFNDKLEDVSGSVKNLLLTMTGGESANVMLLFG